MWDLPPLSALVNTTYRVKMCAQILSPAIFWFRARDAKLRSLRHRRKFQYWDLHPLSSIINPCLEGLRLWVDQAVIEQVSAALEDSKRGSHQCETRAKSHPPQACCLWLMHWTRERWWTMKRDMVMQDGCLEEDEEACSEQISAKKD